MTDMKNSGIAWVGCIPSHWNVHPVYSYFGERRNKNRLGQENNLLSLSYGKIVRKDINTSDGLLPESFNTYNIVEAGDIIIRPTDLQNDKRSLRTGLVRERGIITSAYIDLMPIKEIDSRFFNYQLHAYDVIKVFYNMGNGVRQGLNYSEFSRLLVFEPPIDEQSKIADFLDVKCAEVDALVVDIQAQIDTLEKYKRSVITEAVTKGLNPDVEMKDSGIQWIGMMPSHWNCIRGKYILQYIQKPVREDDGVITCFRDGEVTLRSNRREDGFTVADKEIGYQGIDVGDLVVHGMDGFAGAIGISDSRGKASPVLNVLDTEQNKRYIMYFLRSMAYSDVFLAMATGIRVRSCDLRWNKLAELFYPVPPIEEQEAIVDYIDSVLAKANDVIAAKKEQLSVLEAYKKSLIFEYVTGKKEVPAPITAVMVDPNVILLGKLPKLLNQQKGKIYNQKVLYLLNTYLGLNLGVQYYRYKHGPYDIMLDSYIDTLVENGWCVKTIKNGAENLGIGPNYGAFEEEYGSYFSEHDIEINNLIQFVQPMKRSQIERVATLFAVWNDMILDGNSTPTDTEIVSEVMSGWTENKANFAYDTWLGTLNKMKSNGIVPKGRGLHTLPKDG